MKNQNPTKVLVLGMKLDRWVVDSCVADIGVGNDWATVYLIISAEQGKGHAHKLLTMARKYYENKGKVFGSSVALNSRMEGILKELNITNYT